MSHRSIRIAIVGIRHYGYAMAKDPEIEVLKTEQRQSLVRVLVKVTAYYAVLAGLIAILVTVNPAIVEEFPLGGVGDIAYYGASNVLELEEAFLSADDEELEEIVTKTQRAQLAVGPAWWRGAKSLLIAMFSTLLLMIPVSWVYKAIHKNSIYDHSIDPTTLVLPAVVAGIVTVVQHSLALAFSLAGIAAGVRFRRALSDTFDTLFILASIGVGIAAGIKSIEIAAILTVFFNYAAVLVCAFGDGLESQHLVHSKIRRRHAKQAKRLESQAKADPVDPMSSL